VTRKAKAGAYARAFAYVLGVAALRYEDYGCERLATSHDTAPAPRAAAHPRYRDGQCRRTGVAGAAWCAAGAEQPGRLACRGEVLERLSAVLRSSCSLERCRQAPRAVPVSGWSRRFRVDVVSQRQRGELSLELVLRSRGSPPRVKFSPLYRRRSVECVRLLVLAIAAFRHLGC